MRYLKKFNEEIYPDDEFEDIKSIDYDYYTEFIENYKLISFDNIDIQTIEDFNKKSNLKIENYETNNDRYIYYIIIKEESSPTSKKGLGISIEKFSDDWYIGTLEDLYYNKKNEWSVEFGDKTSYYKCDQIYGLK